MSQITLRERIRWRARRAALPPPFEATWATYSYIGSAHDDVGRPSARLLDLALAAAQGARNVDLRSVLERMDAPSRAVVELWPGEHYRLLASMVRVTQARRVVEIGTASGLATLCMLSQLPVDGSLLTFDIHPWDAKGGTWGGTTHLREQDFSDGRLEFALGDLADAEVFRRWEGKLSQADLIFVDGPKDGVFEPRFLDRLGALVFTSRPILVLDDVRLWNMLALWRACSRPKLDLASFGHWSGTGLIDWTG